MATGICKHHGQVKIVTGVPAGRIVAHLFLTFFTCGFWVFVFAADTLMNMTNRCSVCDGPVTRG